MYCFDWVLVVLVYWSMVLFYRVNVGVVFLMGVVMDVLVGIILGIYSFGLSICVYVLVVNY